MYLDKLATIDNVRAAIVKFNPFDDSPHFSRFDLDIVLPKAYPKPEKYIDREHRAYIRDKKTGDILVTAPSAHELVKKITEGWKWLTRGKEGIFKCQSNT